MLLSHKINTTRSINVLVAFVAIAVVNQYLGATYTSIGPE